MNVNKFGELEDGSQPSSPHLIALLTFLGLLPLVYLIPPLVGRYITDIHGWNVIISVGIIVPIMSYILMPLLMAFVSCFKK